MHHNHVHGERLPNRDCSNCEEQFYSEYEKKYCSERCRRAAVSFAGGQNPNFRGGKTVSECELCGESFTYYPSNKEGLFCPDCVNEEDWRDPPVPDSGADHPWWRGGKTTLACAVCGDEFERYPGNIESEVTVCGVECRAEWLSEAFTGEGHPNWKHGGNRNYGRGWAEVRRKALERDGHQCTVCGVTRAEMGREPDVHHIVPVRTFAESEQHDVEDAHFLDNVVSLCIGCHRKAEFGKIPGGELEALVGVAD